MLAIREPRRGNPYIITASCDITHALTSEALHGVFIQGPTIEVVVIVGPIELFVDPSLVEVLLESPQEMAV